ncbi:class I SAM-dependent methyltransferase [Nocardioides plantarum]|uniref:Class I SAM-dependent methyltransferase n=1 Tax=Nocardioides plantarum TaxID=29299 RepID=A0ABV5KD31_9ACTN|nr:class I SAM-dependent methyltransferase [Nocardioides plantarum]
MDRALSFGSDAEAYDRFRPGYPDSLVDTVLAHADGPVTRALEVGAGTGKATAGFASRGLVVTAIEPDPGMRAVLATRITQGGWTVDVVDATFETVDLDAVGPVDLLYAAAAFHWTDPATRWSRAAAALRPGGVLAVFGCARDLADPALAARVDALTEPVLPQDPTLSWDIGVLREQPAFADVVETTLPRTATMSADDYVSHLTTVSAYRVLPATQRDELLSGVRGLLPDVVEVTEDVPLHLARRTDRSPS